MNYSLKDFMAKNCPDGEKLRLLAVPSELRFALIGSRAAVTETVHTLHDLGFADVSEWSPVLPAPTEGDVMRILTKRRYSES